MTDTSTQPVDVDATDADYEEDDVTSAAADSPSDDAAPPSPSGRSERANRASGDDSPAAAALFSESEIAADYIEGLLDILDYDGDIDELVSGGRPVVEVVGSRLQALVGMHGATIDALQELARLAVFRQTGNPSRLLLDIGGYRAARRKELGVIANNAVEKVNAYGEPVRLDPMNAFERKCVHDVINALDGVQSESEGVEPSRRIVVRPVG